MKAHENLQVALALSARAIVGTAAPSSLSPLRRNKVRTGRAAQQAKALEAMQERIEHLEVMQKRIEQLEAELNQVKAQSGAPAGCSQTGASHQTAAAPAASHTTPELPLYATLGAPSLGSALHATSAACGPSGGGESACRGLPR